MLVYQRVVRKHNLEIVAIHWMIVVEGLLIVGVNIW